MSTYMIYNEHRQHKSMNVNQFESVCWQSFSGWWGGGWGCWRKKMLVQEIEPIASHNLFTVVSIAGLLDTQHPLLLLLLLLLLCIYVRTYISTYI